MMRWRRSVLLTACGALLGAAATPAFAAPAAADRDLVYDAGNLVEGHPGMNYLDLIRLVIPDMALSPDDHRIHGHLTTAPRHIAGPDFDGQLPDVVELGSIEDRRILIGGKRRIALLADLGPNPDRVQGVELLILLDDTPTPTVLDVADVAVDKDTFFAEQSTLKLGAGDTALITHSEHDEADLTMGSYLLISTVGDRLQLVQRVATPSERVCAWSDIETTRFSTLPDPGGPYPRIQLSVRAEFKRNKEEGCGENGVPDLHPQTFRAIYAWDPASHAFVTHSDAVKRLDAFNDIVFNR